jgi:2-dehydropantoate 2-reductase
MRIAIVGSGGVGGYYGGLLARAGQEVIFFARGAHLQALRDHGLQVKSVHGDFNVAPVQATDNLAGIGAVDWALVCVKAPDIEQAARSLLPMVGSETAAVNLQNGVDAAERLAAVIGMEHVVAGATWISSAIEAPGVIHQMSDFRRIVIGEMDGRITPRIQALQAAFQQAGLTIELSSDIRKVLWTKFVFISGTSGVGSLTRLPIGSYRNLPETRRIIVGLMREVEAVGRAEGVALDADVVDKALAILDGSAPAIKPSMQRDVETGRRSELEAIIGVIVRKGQALGVPTPLAETLYGLLLPGDLAGMNNLADTK